MSSHAHSDTSHRARGVTLMLASTACFTANVLLIRALGNFESVNVWLVSCVRFAAGMAVVFALYRREFQFTRVFTQRKLALRGVIGGASVYGYYLTVVELGAGRATFINNTYVIIGALLAVWILGERFGRELAIGSVIALVGLALLTDALNVTHGINVYDLLGIAMAFASAYVVITIRQLHATEHTSTIFAAQCLYGVLICGAPALLQLQAVSLPATAMMIGAGVCAALGQISMTHGFRALSVAKGSLLQMLVPLGIAVGGATFFGERFTSQELIGAALILGGTVFTAIRR